MTPRLSPVIGSRVGAKPMDVMLPEPFEEPPASWKALLRLSAATRWLVALALLLAALAAWLEMTAPAHPQPVFLAAVALAGLFCGAGPGLAVALGAIAAIWCFALREPGTASGMASGVAGQAGDMLLVFIVAVAAILVAAELLRRRLIQVD